MKSKTNGYQKEVGLASGITNTLTLTFYVAPRKVFEEPTKQWLEENIDLK